MKRNLSLIAIAIVLTGLSVRTSQASDAASRVDIGRRHARAEASYDGPAGMARTDTRVGRVNFARGLAVSYGIDGVSLSQSIGVSHGGLSTAHNFQLSIGPGGTHLSRGGVVTRGGDSRAITSGHTSRGRGGPRGGSSSTGTGHDTRAWSSSESHPRWSSHPWFRSTR